MLMQPNGTLGVIYYACRFHKFSSWAKTKRSRDFSLIPLIGLVPSFGIVLVLCNQRASNHWSDRWKLWFWYVCPLNAPNVFFIILKPHQHFLTSTETSQPNSISCVMNSLSSLSSVRASWCLPLRKAVVFSFPSHRMEVVLTHPQQRPSTLPPATSQGPTLLLLLSSFLDSLSQALSILIKVTAFYGHSAIPPAWSLIPLWVLWLPGYQKPCLKKRLQMKELLLCSFFSHLGQHNDVAAPGFTAGRLKPKSQQRLYGFGCLTAQHHSWQLWLL